MRKCSLSYSGINFFAAGSTNKKAINDTRFQEYVVSYPSKIEQDLIGEKVDKIFSKIEELKKNIQDEYEKLEELV